MQRADTERGEVAQSKEVAASSQEASHDERAAQAYEPPRLVRVGTLRNLLGKSGRVPDKGPPFELHQ